MTGTAKTEEKEFVEIYDLHVVEIPTNVPVARRDENDYIFKTKDAKFAAVIDDIKERYEKGQPVLVGTIAVETSEYLSELPEAARHPAQRPEREGARARVRDHQGRGPAGAVTIATNMAGRGVDIKLGEGVVDAGGLYVLATERHESRRIDNQLARPLRAARATPADALLPLRRGRPRAPVRRRPDQEHHRALQAPGRPADGGEDPLEADRERPEEGRGAELRRAQERPQVRRRDERAAAGDLRAAPPRARRRRPLRRRARVDPRGRRDERRQRDRRRTSPEDGISTPSSRRCRRSTAPTSRWRSCARRSSSSAMRSSRSSSKTRSRASRREEGVRRGADARDRALRDRSRSSTRAGAGTSTRWTTCATAYLRAMARRTRSSSTAARDTRCSRSSAARSAEVVLTLFHARQIEVDGENAAAAARARGERDLPSGTTAAGAEAIAAAGEAPHVGRTPVRDPRPAATAHGSGLNEHKDVGRNDPCWCGSGRVQEVPRA